MIRYLTLNPANRTTTPARKQDAPDRHASYLSTLQRWLRIQSPFGPNPAQHGDLLPRHDSRKMPVQASNTLTLLKLAAVSLPGLASTPILANESVEWLADTQPLAQIQAGAGYVPTGASRLEGVVPDGVSSSKRYRISCFDDGSGKPARLRLRVQGMDRSAGALVSATLERNGDSRTVIDTTNGNLVYSDYASLDQGQGEYILTVRKVKKSASAPDSTLNGATPFKTAQECNTANGAYTGISMPVEIPGDNPGPNPTPKPPAPGPVGPVSSSKLQSFSSSLSKNTQERRFVVTCSANSATQDTARYKFQIKAANKNRPYTLQMTVQKDGYENAGVVDLIGGDSAFSEQGVVEGGNGPYQVIVRKVSETGDTLKPMAFQVKHVCETSEKTRGNLKKINQ
jgi:hypothetical protein